jgi:hypothetical protein
VLALALQDSRKNLNEFAAKVTPLHTILDAGLLDAHPALSYGVGNPKGSSNVPVNVLLQPDGRIANVQGGYENAVSTGKTDSGPYRRKVNQSPEKAWPHEGSAVGDKPRLQIPHFVRAD